jgi:cell division inhibitor SulA
MIQRSYPSTTTQSLSRYNQTSVQPAAPHNSTLLRNDNTNSELSVQTVLAVLANLTKQAAFQHGWLLLIAPPWQLTKSMLEQAGIQSQRILLIPQRQIGRFDNLMRDALTCATCSAVVSFLAAEQTELEDYRYLSAKYGTPLLNMTTDLPAQNLLTH